MQLKSFKKPKKILIMLWGRESLTRFDQPKKKKQTKTKSAVERPTGENKIIAKQQKKPANTTHPVQAKKEACNNKKPIIITKMKLKIAFSF
jgi:hypothetical protein